MLPVRPLLQPGGLVAQGGEERHVLVGHQLGDDGGKFLAGRVDLGDGDEVLVAREVVGEPGERDQGGLVVLEPVRAVLDPVEQPGLEGLLLECVPPFGGPAALVLGPLDHSDGAGRLDGVDPLLHDLAVGGRPVGRNLGDGRGPVPLEPLAAGFTSSDATRKHNLEGALAEGEFGDVGGAGILGDTQVLGVQVVERVDLPI